MNYIKIEAVAKINIGLRVLEKRTDGYHNIQTLFYPISGLYDEIIITKNNQDEINGNFPFPIDNQNNLIIRAKQIIENEINLQLKCKIEVKKIIPIGAGLGGGSSDAAATLKALNILFKLNLPAEKLEYLALQLGSDVPFFIQQKPSIGLSRGEVLKAISLKIPYHILLINPNIHISTKEAFENTIPKYELNNYEKLDFMYIQNLLNYQNEIINDFENFIFEKYPEIKKIQDIMLNNDAVFSKMTGTGSTVFGFFQNIEAINKVIKLIPKEYFYHIEKYSN